jgi:DNA-binding CsgD family transcriptional regulator
MNPTYLPPSRQPEQFEPRGRSNNMAVSNGLLSASTALPGQPAVENLPGEALHQELVAVLRELLARAEAEGLPLTTVDGGAGVGLVIERGELRFALVVDAAFGRNLSPRELQIARLVADGATNRAIGSVLDISLWTVSTHLRRIFAKLGVGSRAEMVAQLFGAPSVPGAQGRRTD